MTWELAAPAAEWQLTLTDDGRELRDRDAERRAAGTVPLTGPAGELLAAMAGINLKQLHYSVTPGNGCSHGDAVQAALNHNGLGGQARRVDVELDRVLAAQRFCPPAPVRSTLRYALLAALGTGILYERDRRSLWTPWLNASRQELPA